MSKVTKFGIIELLRKESAFISPHFQQNYDVNSEANSQKPWQLAQCKSLKKYRSMNIK